MSSKVQDELKNLSNEPGVYIFKDQSQKIIYIGKAINLKSRVRSYWNESSWKDRPKLRNLVPKVFDVETIITKSEKEALILESNLVFKHQPKYNVLLKANDKQYPWLVITYDEAYPRLIPVRAVEDYKSKKRNSKNKFYGPYTNVSAMYENLVLVNELFPLRKKRIPPFKDRPCLNYDLGKCLAPCQKLVSEEDYQLMLDQVEMVLKGDYQDLLKMLKIEMQRFSEQQEYERAAKIRDRIKALETFNEKQNVVFDDKNLDQDAIALAIDNESDTACLQVFKTRSGKLISRDTVELDLNEENSEEEIFDSAFEQYYSNVPADQIPKEILCSHKLSNYEAYSEWLSEKKESKVKILTPQKGEKLAQIKLASRNAKVIIERIKLERLEEASKDINIALNNLQNSLDLRMPPERIECFDISHIQGHATVASMVTFIDGMPEKNQYKRFKISQDQNDDFASMKEVISRRYKNKEAIPNLIIIDGGKGQLNAAWEALKDLELEHINCVSLAKEQEEIFLPEESRPLILDRRSPELFLVQRIRNEAHRFAITYHRQLRSNRSFKSKLDDIPGLGPKKKEILLEKYPTLSKIKAASLEELAALRGFTKELAMKILETLS
ncbi:MAG: excinuclease ABC subunit UvrC [Candidatus Caenarcaniphilales bacterium]|jgi:excinuclease ABC subunit C|nr:excinuclease ABC subunit UvrC [Candidatus Caenarcaniphilales bacterium]